MAKIIFLSPKHEFSGIDLRKKALGGIPGNTIMLSEALVRSDHNVVVHNAIKRSENYNGVNYVPFKYEEKIVADLAIANNSARPFQNVKAVTKVVWQRNRTNWGRAYKRREIWQLLRDRPNLVCLSPDAVQNTPKTLPYRSKTIIQHGIEEKFCRTHPMLSPPLKPQVLYASRPSRGFDWVLEVWKKYILPEIPNAVLNVCTPKQLNFTENETESLKSHNIIYHGSIPQSRVVELMHECRALLYPGHKNETGCSVALQSMASGLPIITSGYGCLKDQVQHGVTGFIETDPAAYAKRAINCIQDDFLWLKLHRNSLKSEWIKDWDSVAKRWQEVFIK